MVSPPLFNIEFSELYKSMIWGLLIYLCVISYFLLIHAGDQANKMGISLGIQIQQSPHHSPIGWSNFPLLSFVAKQKINLWTSTSIFSVDNKKSWMVTSWINSFQERNQLKREFTQNFLLPCFLFFSFLFGLLDLKINLVILDMIWLYVTKKIIKIW